MAMKKFINDPKDLNRELLEGFAIAHRDGITIKSEKIVRRAKPKAAISLLISVARRCWVGVGLVMGGSLLSVSWSVNPHLKAWS